MRRRGWRISSQTCLRFMAESPTEDLCMRRFQLTVALVAGFGLAGSAGAQQPAPPAQGAAPPATPAPQQATPKGIEEILVTAERREQNLQDVAQTVSAFSTEDLTSGNVQDAYDLQLKVPGLVATGGLPAITLRGLGQDPGVLGPGIDPGFQLHVNDIYVSQIAIALLSFNDLERVEVLPGPQGTLYGRNSTGGSMNFHTKRPLMSDWEMSGDVDVSLWNNTRLRAVLNVPLVSEKLAARIAYQREWPSDVMKLEDHGHEIQTLTNNALSGGHNVRGTLRWIPTEWLTTDFILGYSVDKDDGGWPRPLGDYPTYAPGQSTIFVGGVNPNAATPNSGDVRENRANRRQTQEYSTYWGQMIAEIQIPKHVVKLNGNYQYWDYAIDRDQDMTDIDSQRLVLEDRHFTYTGEATITSQYDGPFSWLFGGNYQSDQAPHTDVPVWAYQQQAELANWQVVDVNTFSYFSPDVTNLCGGVPCVNQPGNPDVPLFHFESSVDTQTAGVFADGGYDITEHFHFQGGVRYSWTKRDFKDYSSHQLLLETFDVVTDAPGGSPICAGVGAPGLTKEQCFAFVIAPAFLNPQLALIPGSSPATPANTAFLLNSRGCKVASATHGKACEMKKTWDSVTGRARFEWRPIDDQLFYVGYSRGERHGGFNYNQEAPFDPETINAYEVGAKNTLLDGRLILDTSGFYYDFTNRFILLNQNNVPFTTNAPDSNVYGIELQWIWAPIDPLQISGNVGWLKAQFIDDFVSQDQTVTKANPTAFCPGNQPGEQYGYGPTCHGAPLRNLNGNTFPRSPEWTLSMSAQYRFELGFGALTPRVDFAYRGDTNFRQYENPLDLQKAYTRTDLRVRLDLTDQPLWFELYAQNLEDNQKIKTQVEAQERAPRYYWLATPLTVGLRMGWNFSGATLSDALPFGS
jgi:iron complex outermembrane receptor protein